MSLGWMMPCLDVADLPRSVAFYEQLGFRQIGGAPEQGWAIMGNGPLELGLYCGHFRGWMLNFRGANVPQLMQRWQAAGVEIQSQSRYSADMWPEASNEFEGQPLPYEESGDCTILDPEGRVLYFDTYPIERIRYRRGDPYATDGYDGSYVEGQPRLGSWLVEVHTSDPDELKSFYNDVGSASGFDFVNPELDWRLSIIEAARADHVLVAHCGDAPARELTDPDSWRFAIRS